MKLGDGVCFVMHDEINNSNANHLGTYIKLTIYSYVCLPYTYTIYQPHFKGSPMQKEPGNEVR